MFAKYPEARDIPALRQLWQEAFGDDDAFLDKFFSTGYHQNRCRVVMQANKAAAALYWFDCHWEGKKLAYLYAVATAKAFQGQGLCRRLMEDTHRLLAEQGYAGGILVPGSDNLFNMYEKMGYRTISTIREFTQVAGEEVFPLEKISGAEYALRRKAMLPAGGIVQEGAGLAFLETYAAFYVGNGCLLCGIQDGQKLIVPEFLGDTSHIPGILRYLSCKEGSFRTPGEGKPFAMYHCLTDDVAAPTYLGHAYD
ncbi:MAG: GNAT family N-acetyltransferase [Oscillospiraceae bacterium]|nr:GNAT family N-acetyltransferase [Oscillospiraceae bacterium]